MKKLVLAAITIILVCLGLQILADKLNNSGVSSGSKDLIIYNWGDYIDPKLLKKFEKQTGYHVIYETFDSNESMYTKIKQGGTAYDICIPSDYMVSKMKESHLLKKINLRNIANIKNIDPQFMNQSFDYGNKYSIPYFWGTLGIIYNDKFVKKGEIKHWNDLWKSKFKHQILLVDSARDIMGLSLISMKNSVNSQDSLKLKLAKTKLDALGSNVKAIIADELKMYMIRNEASIGVTWSGEARTMLNENPHLHYVVPSEGSNLWLDNIVIPKTAKNQAGAYAFINFMLDPKNAAQNAKYIGYATPNMLAKKLLPDSIKKDRQFYPATSTMKHLQVFKNLRSEKIQEYNDLFLEFKMYAH
ncbi:ABC transporter substrate-binding protein [Lactobacillus iners]|jgi:spermidine/putrescine ABC superfamily ATP binding cassette transporter, binding protein|uniref:ABC transporter substrate-binding protein n=1 Tax=Lactobacillus iners TaxID=147802 RepID=UPI0001E98CD0|nr:ABC transporter substrate-binding protein [Lactobacillus iners]EFQ49198.1 ABC transporter, solute-binding protein [Lactobacillus iners LEAF 2052A-d]EFQ51486.1 ABC transporter, solute-binding protein [Lactobacillus iners LEAF 3008A-a]MCT7675417.1 ABC transporter substrate-binding protein [Lactobacillus iners]MCT7677154.1 ABC transporter substrate-binding protein [Lactobacillus iners]MCT7683888.1 ABC transporter substrate-binding protein [Lactobacillus iners]